MGEKIKKFLFQKINKRENTLLEGIKMKKDRRDHVRTVHLSEEG